MRSLASLIALVAMTFILSSCTPIGLNTTAQDVSIDANDSDLTNIFLPKVANIMVNSTGNDTRSLNRCYEWDKSEKWKDVGGQHSDFVKQSVYDLCQLIAIWAYKGFPTGNTIKYCKEVRAHHQGRDYDRSIGVSLRYMGPMLQFNHITAGYCNDRMKKAMDCGAGGEFDLHVNNPDLPPPWVSDRWEAKADPNRRDCHANGYDSNL